MAHSDDEGRLPGAVARGSADVLGSGCVGSSGDVSGSADVSGSSDVSGSGDVSGSADVSGPEDAPVPDDAVYRTDVEGVVTSWDAGAEQLFGWPADEVIGQPDMVLVPHDRRGELLDLAQAVYAGRHVPARDTVRVRRDGTAVHVAVSLSPVRPELGEVVGATVVARDLGPQRAAAEQASLLAAVVRSSSEAIVATSLDGVITVWNPAAESLFGYPEDEVLGRTTAELGFDPDPGSTAPVRQALAAGDPIDRHPTWRRHRDGHQVEVAMTAFPVEAEGRIVGVSAIFGDLGAQRRETEHRALLASVVESSTDGILAVRDGLIRSWNRGAAVLFGWAEDEVLGLPHGFNCPPERVGEIEVMLGGEPGPLETIRLRRDGTPIPVSLTVSPVEQAPGDTGHVFSIVARDITRQRQLEDRLRHQALHDPLTGAANRNVLADHLDLALRRARRRRSKVLVAFVDLDDFKAINDERGHAYGDRLLKAVADRLSETVRAEDTVARYGGDEFVVVCEVVDDADAAAIPVRLKEHLDLPFPLDGGELLLSASVGVAVGDGGADADALLSEADRTMYRAKRGSDGSARALGARRAAALHHLHAGPGPAAR